MAGSMGLGFMAAFAVSGSVVLIARQVHKRLLSDFMKKMELELAGSRRSCQDRKKVRFADDVMEPSSNNKEYRKRHLVKITTEGNDEVLLHRSCDGGKLLEAMPLNRRDLYEAVMKS
ncbi:hypothetical protein OIU76_021183 [Salix suchowensis]|nr:Carotenoid isomerase, chloroplast precursor [Salix suchowensis]KAJ6300330.1 hypothetical protein OIU76_021183 [Salix suchowensis]KAJ6303941.1 hypothetical protein OIU77_017759 [Salix suchowensis]